MKKPSINSSLWLIGIAVLIFLLRPVIVKSSLNSQSRGGGYLGEINAANEAANLAATIDIFGVLILLVGLGLLIKYFIDNNKYNAQNKA